MRLGSDLLLSNVRKTHVRAPFFAPMSANLSLGLYNCGKSKTWAINPIDNSMTYRYTRVVCVFDGRICCIYYIICISIFCC